MRIVEALHIQLRAKYEEKLDPEMWRVYLYMGIGLSAFFLVSFLPSPPSSVVSGVILATAVFSFHDYIGQKIENLIDFFSSRYNYSLPSSNASALLSTTCVALLDLFVAVPMFAYSEYTILVGIGFVIFVVYWVFLKISVKLPFMMRDSIFDRLAPRRYVGKNFIIFLVALLFLLDNWTETLHILKLILPSQDIGVILQFSFNTPTSSPDFSIVFIGIITSIFIVDFGILIGLIYLYSIIFYLWRSFYLSV